MSSQCPGLASCKIIAVPGIVGGFNDITAVASVCGTWEQTDLQP